MDVESQKEYVNETKNYRVRPGKTNNLYINAKISFSILSGLDEMRDYRGEMVLLQ